MKKNESENNVSVKLIAYALLFNIALSIFLIVWSFGPLGSPKVVYVDAIKLVSNYRGMQETKAELETKISMYTANLDTLKMELSLKISEYGSTKSKLTASEKTLFEELLASKEQQLNNYHQMVQEKIQNENLQLTQKVLDTINAYVKKYGEANGYELILAATQQGNVVYGTENVDITQKILDGLNQEYKPVTK